MSLTRPTAREVLLGLNLTDLTADQRDEAERNFFNQIKLANGTRKTTAVDRLTDVNEVCNRILNQRSSPVELLDVGISSGITTVEWMQSLSDAGVEYHLDGFDLCLDASIHSIADWFHVLCDSEGIPLEFEISGFPVGNYFGETFFHKLKRFVPIILLRVIYRIAKAMGFGKLRKHSVKLVTHRLNDAPNLRVFEFDVSEVDKLQKKYDMIRAANILNIEYFDRGFIADSVGKIKACLVQGGFFCAARTLADGSNHATVFQERGGCLEVVQRLGDGSEIEAIVVGV